MVSAGERFGPYTLVRYQGAKPTGALWSAKSDRGLEVLVHVAPIEHRREEEIRAKVADKLKTAIRVQHDNVIRVLDAGFERGHRFIVTESVDGVELSKILRAAKREGGWPDPFVAGWVAHEVARALSFAHGLGVVHGDVAPRTIFVERSGAVKLAEFVGPLEAQELIKTAGQEQSGLLAYLSPELASSGESGAPGDVFALGVVLWELLSRRPLFVRSTDLETLDAVKAAELPPMPEEAPRELAAIAEACLSKSPAGRPAAEEAARRLQSAIAAHRSAGPAGARLLAEMGFKDRDRVSDPPSVTPLGPRGTLPISEEPHNTLPSDPPSAATRPAGADEPSSDPFYDARRDGFDWHGGRFEVLERLGSGGMGEVYRVRDRELDEVVALKLIPRESTLVMKSTERLKREVRLARKIASPFVCRIYDFVDLGSGLRGLTMAFVQGTTLADLMRSGVEVDYRRFARWGADIAEGLQAAHDLSIVHRDLKPENVMIRGDDRAIILDFGIALSAEANLAEGGMKLTQAGMIMGTPLYMSPEQVLNLPLDGRSDLFALGLILAELITGEVPMRGTNYAELLEKRVTKAVPFHLGSVDPGAPAELQASVDAMLATAKVDRPASAGEVARRLRDFAEGRSTAAPPPAAPPAPEAPPPPPTAPPRGAPRMLIIAALVALVLVLAGIVVVEARRSREPVTAPMPDAAAAPLIETVPDAGPPPSPPDAGRRDAGRKYTLPPAEPM